MSLYNISHDAISALVEPFLRTSELEDGKHEVTEKAAGQHRYPLKVVFSIEEGELTVITAYPLRRGLKK
ncbi:MAG: hypothetical protein SWQ30_04020 [Thermodesulfobacteriota bacterium]|nr:hypothetical protein [Thermodesulfobacteriota bacterium]